MQFEIVASVQLGLYGAGWLVAAILIRDHRSVLGHWAAYALLETVAAVMALPSQSSGSAAGSLTLAVSFASFCAGVRGIDRFSENGPRLDRFVWSCLAAVAAAFTLLHFAPSLVLGRDAAQHEVLRAGHLVYSIASAVLWMTATPLLWRQLRKDLNRMTAVVALGPGFSMGLLALMSVVMHMTVQAPQAAVEVREAMRVPNLLFGLVASAIFHFGLLFLFVSRLLSRLNRLANRDHLTGLANRREIDRALTAACARHARDKTPFAVAIVDLLIRHQ